MLPFGSPSNRPWLLAKAAGLWTASWYLFNFSSFPLIMSLVSCCCLRAESPVSGCLPLLTAWQPSLEDEMFLGLFAPFCKPPSSAGWQGFLSKGHDKVSQFSALFGAADSSRCQASHRGLRVVLGCSKQAGGRAHGPEGRSQPLTCLFHVTVFPRK